MAAAAPAEKKQPASVSVDAVRPAGKGYNLTVKVIEAKIVVNRPKGPKGTPLKVSECLVGDKSGVIVFSARNEQADLAQPGAYLTLRNAKIDMYRGSMRLVVDQGGKVEEASGETFAPKVDNNLSLIEYELVLPTAPAAEKA